MVFNDRKSGSARQKKTNSFHESAVTILTPTCHFNGKLYCQGSSRIGGKIEGEIVSEGLLIIEEEAVIKANIKADEVVIMGRVEGCLEAGEAVILEASGRFNGDIVTSSLVIKEGAHFNGSTRMIDESTAEKRVGASPVVEKIVPKGKKDRHAQDKPLPEIGLNA